MKISTIKNSGLIAALVVLISCNHTLDLEPLSEETNATAYEKASQIEAALIGTYESFHNDYYTWDVLAFQDVRSDNHYAGGDNPEVFEFDFLTVTSTNSRLFKNWGDIYNAIAKANTVLDRLDDVIDPILTDTRREQIRGEAYFLRAYHYYTLVTLWGGVPLVTSSVTSVKPEDVQLPISTADQVYDQILADLALAINLLPETYGTDKSVNKGRATFGAAHALAARASAQRPTPNYTDVLSHIEALEGSSANYRLIDYAELFDGNNYNNDESILEVQYLGGNDNNWGPQMLLPPSISGDTWRKFVTPSQDLINAFDAQSDVVRKNATVLFESAPWVDEYWGNAVNSSIPFGYKWKSASGWNSSNRSYLLRYGDMVLLKAEALNELNRTDEAADEADRIRLRVNLPVLDNATRGDKALMRQAILDERRLELAQEGHRWNDLVRYGMAVSTMNSLNEIDLRTNQAVNYAMSESKIFLPIPQQEIDRNPKLK